MDSRHRQQLLEQYEEAAMLLLMDEYAEADGARLLRQFAEAEKNGEVSQMPSALDDACRSLIQGAFAKASRRNRLRRFARGLGRAAVYGLVILGLTATVVLSVEALRVPVLNFFLESHDKYSTILFTQEAPSEALIRKLEAALSGEYDLIIEEYAEAGNLFLLFQNRDQDILSLSISTATGQILVDTENANPQTVTLNGQQAYLIAGDGYRILWLQEETNQLFDLYASGMDEESFRILVREILSSA